MKTDSLVNTEYFSQFKLVLEAGEVAELGAFMIDQTFYILTAIQFKTNSLIHCFKNTEKLMC